MAKKPHNWPRRSWPTTPMPTRLGVDMPIGPVERYVERGKRQAYSAARRFLKGQAFSVFSLQRFATLPRFRS